MRTVLLLLIAALPLASGCTSVAPKAVHDLLSDLTTREQVHARFGTPIATGIVNGHEYEEFRDLVWRDNPLHASVSDATFRFMYDPTGRVTSAYADVDERVRPMTSQDFSEADSANRRQ